MLGSGRAGAGQLRPARPRGTIAEVDEDLPHLEEDDLTRILIILMRIEAKLDALFEEDDGEEEDRS